MDLYRYKISIAIDDCDISGEDGISKRSLVLICVIASLVFCLAAISVNADNQNKSQLGLRSLELNHNLSVKRLDGLERIDGLGSGHHLSLERKSTEIPPQLTHRNNSKEPVNRSSAQGKVQAEGIDASAASGNSTCNDTNQCAQKVTLSDNHQSECLGNAPNKTEGLTAQQPSAATISAAIDQQLLDAIDSLAPCYYNRCGTWQITLEEYKAWIATIAWSEGNKGGYSAQSQCRYLDCSGSDMIYHRDVGSQFRFSTGIGPFQLDRGYDNWDYWPTIDKLNYQMALESAFKFHSNTFNDPKKTYTLKDFSDGSRWYGVRPNKPPTQESVADLWNDVTGTLWSDYNSGKNENNPLKWDGDQGIKASLALKAQNRGDMSYDSQITYKGYIQWSILKSDQIFTDSTKKKQIIFDGEYPTWYISARTAAGVVLYKYYYTYYPNDNLEVWAYDDPGHTFQYIFVRDYSKSVYPVDCTGDFSKHVYLLDCTDYRNAGFTLSHPFFSLGECQWNGMHGVLTSPTYPLRDNQGKNHYFVRGSDNGLWDNEDGTWKGLGNYITSAPCAVIDKAGLIHVFARGNDGALLERVVGGSWIRHTGGIMPGSNPSAALSPDGHIKVVVEGLNKALFITDLSIGGWSPLGGCLYSNPQIIYDSQGKMHVFVKGSNGALYDNVDGNWKCQNGLITSDARPILNPFNPKFIDTYVRGGDGTLCVNELNTQQGSSTWTKLGGFIKPANGNGPIQATIATGVIEGNPDPVIDADGIIHTFVCGKDGALWDNANGKWYGLGGLLTSDPNALRDKNGRIRITVCGSDTALWVNTVGLNKVLITIVGPAGCDYTKIQAAVDASPSGGIIKVLSGTYKENVQIDKSLTVIGDGMGKTIVDGSHAGSVFAIGKTTPSVNVTLSGMTITDGNATKGGGIYNQGKLELDDCLIAENAAHDGSGVYSNNTINLAKCYVYQNTASNVGGGIVSHGRMNMTNGIVLNNTASQNGGGIYSDIGGTLNLEGSLILLNNAKENGGGIYNSGTMAMNNSSILFDNNAVNGGGIYNSQGEVTATEVIIFGNNVSQSGGGVDSYGTFTMNGGTISGNTATVGGGIENGGTSFITGSSISRNTASPKGYCGGIHNRGKLIISSSVISNNTGNSGGGGIYNDQGSGVATIENSTVYGNIANYGGGFYNCGSVVIKDSEIIGNLANISDYYFGGIGGGVFNYDPGSLTIMASTISKNNAGTDGDEGSGGGIANYYTANISNCTITGNVIPLMSGPSNGGGIFNSWIGTMSVRTSIISANIGMNGGGLQNTHTMNITDCTITGNKGIDGGGIENSKEYSYSGGPYIPATLKISSSNISGNTAWYGGGIDNAGIMAALNNTISKNRADVFGGGIYNTGTIDQYYNGASWVYVLSPASLNVTNSIISNNIASYPGNGSGIYSGSIASISGSTVSSNTASGNGGGIYSSEIFYSYYNGTSLSHFLSPAILKVTDSNISNNIAYPNGGGIFTNGTLSLGGLSLITNNQARNGYGGGIYSMNKSMTFDGPNVAVKSNKAHLPTPSELSWYQGWGVYLTSGIPITTNGFNPATQVTGNTHI